MNYIFVMNFLVVNDMYIGEYYRKYMIELEVVNYVVLWIIESVIIFVDELVLEMGVVWEGS